VIAGYPWFGDWGRDTMIALPGLAIATGRPEIAGTILRSFAAWLDRGMLPNVFPEQGESPHYNTADASLWFVEAVRQTVAATGERALLEELFAVLIEIIQRYREGTRFRIQQQADGLLHCGEAGVQVTWMDAKVGDRVITPRIGKPIEINALWYNALRSMEWFAGELGLDPIPYGRMAAHTRTGMERFWCESRGHCFDVLDGPQGNDPALRPNQILAVSLPAIDFPGEALFDSRRRRAIVEAVGRELLTSFGLRSLSPTAAAYAGRYRGDPAERDSHYHQGPVWGWLLGPFVAAHLRVFGDPAAALRLLTPMEDQLEAGCVGSLAEIFDGDAPHDPRGAFAQAWTVAEVLRAWRLVSTVSRPGHDGGSWRPARSAGEKPR
jgi:predicted glycogen debranching enzyme